MATVSGSVLTACMNFHTDLRPTPNKSFAFIFAEGFMKNVDENLLTHFTWNDRLGTTTSLFGVTIGTSSSRMSPSVSTTTPGDIERNHCT